MRQVFEPVQAPSWQKEVSDSGRSALSDIWPTPLRLKEYPTADLPPAADWDQGLAYDSTLGAVKYSDGTDWFGLSAYDGALHPRHFGATMDGSDDSAAINAFLAVIASEGWPGGSSMEGSFSIASPLVLDGGTFGADLKFSLDFGSCHITALTAIETMFTIQDCHGLSAAGRLHLKGTGVGSNDATTWTCDRGLFLSNCAQSIFSSIYGESLGYSAVEFDGTSSNSDSIFIGKVAGKRVGSGSPTGSCSISANWTRVSDSGSSGTTTQYTEITVDTLPSAFMQANTAGVPTSQMLVEIVGQLCHVKYIDPATGTLRVYPWVDSTSGASGTLKYHYGAGVVFLGGDSSLITIAQADFNQASTVAQLTALYGSNFGHIHGEANGSLTRLGLNSSVAMGKVRIDTAHGEGNTFRHINMSASLIGISIGSHVGGGPEEDYDVYTPSAAGPTRGAVQAWRGVTVDAGDTANGLYGGHHFGTKRYVLGSANETLDFSAPATFRGKCFYAPGNLTLTLVAPSAALKANFRYDVAEIMVLGDAANGAIDGTLTFVPPAGHTINGGAADASLAFTAASLSAPAKLAIVALASGTDWLVYPAASRIPQIQSVTSAATVAPTFLNDQVNITAQAEGLTLANPSGTAIPAKQIVIRIKDNGTARAIAYGTQYRAIGITLPTTTVISKTLYLQMIYNSADTKWDVLKASQEA